MTDAYREQLPKRRALLRYDNEKYTEGVEKMEAMTDRLMKLQDEIAAMQPKLQVLAGPGLQLLRMRACPAACVHPCTCA